MADDSNILEIFVQIREAIRQSIFQGSKTEEPEKQNLVLAEELFGVLL